MKVGKLKNLTFKTTVTVSSVIVVLVFVLSTVLANTIFLPKSDAQIGANFENNEKQHIQKEKIDPGIVSVSSKKAKIPTAPGRQIKGQNLTILQDNTLPKSKISKKGKAQTKYELEISLDAPKSVTPAINQNDTEFKTVKDWTDLKTQAYDDTLENVITLNNDAAQRDIKFNLSSSQNFIFDNSIGGHIVVKDSSTEDDLFILKAPQGIDSENNRIDYKFKVENNNTIVLTPNRPQQFDFAVYPVNIYFSSAPLEWYEALVQVGKNCENTGCGEDGDIIDIKPAGWNWGTEEKNKFVIVKIDKLDKFALEESLSKTERQDEYDVNLGNGQKQHVQAVNPGSNRLHSISGLVRYGIDYTSIATTDELDTIRDTAKMSPILDGRNRPVIKKKNNPLASVVDENKKLDYVASTEKPKSKADKFWETFIKPAHALSTVSKTIGSAVGRDYSTLTAWEAGQQGNLVSLDQIHEGVAYKDSTLTGSGTNVLDIAGSTTDSTRYMKLTVASSDRHTGIPNTGAIADGQAARGVIQARDSYTVVEWLEITGCTGAAGRNCLTPFNNGSASTGIIFQYLIIHSYLDATNTVNGLRTPSDISGITFTVRNCFFQYGDDTALRTNNATDNMTIENVTIYDITGRAIYTPGNGTVSVKNTISINPNNSTNNDFVLSGTVTQNNNMSGDTSAAGTGSVTNASAASQFVDASTTPYNVHLVTGSGAKDTGATLASVTDDIDGNSRPQNSIYDMGADEYVSPITYEQSAFRFLDNANNTTAGTALAANSTAATLTATGAQFRLRLLIHVAGAQLSASGQDFKLQYAGKGAGTCASPSGTPSSYTDVTTVTSISYYNNASPADGATLTANAGNDPTHSSDTVVNQTYEEANNFTNSVAAIPAGQDGKWDFSLYDNGASANTAYCFRVVKSNGSAINTYTQYPQITTYNPPAGPSLDQLLRHGGWFSGGVKKPYTF